MKVVTSLKIIICGRSFTTSDTEPMGRQLNCYSLLKFIVFIDFGYKTTHTHTIKYFVTFHISVVHRQKRPIPMKSEQSIIAN